MLDFIDQVYILGINPIESLTRTRRYTTSLTLWNFEKGSNKLRPMVHFDAQVKLETVQNFPILSPKALSLCSIEMRLQVK